MLGGDQGANLVGVFFQQHFEFAHDPRALERRGGAPSRVSGVGRRNGLLDRHFVGQQQALFSLAGGRVENILCAAAASDQFAVNQMLNQGKGLHKSDGFRRFG